MVDVWREENAVDVGGVGLERGHWDQRRGVGFRDHAPDVDIALERSQTTGVSQFSTRETLG